MYYQVDEENNTIYILHFRSSSQKPLVISKLKN